MSTLVYHLRRYRIWIILAALLVLAVTALASNASAWTSEDINPAEGEFRSAIVYYEGSEWQRDEYGFPFYTSIPISTYDRGYMSYPVSHLDDRTYIAAASITIIAGNSISCTINVKVMDREMHELFPSYAFKSISTATSVGNLSINAGSSYRTFSLDITGGALDVLRTAIGGEDDYLVIGFDPVGRSWVDLIARYVDTSGTYYSTLTLEYDNEAPDVPTPTYMDAYIAGDHVPVAWSPSTDNPSGGNRGDITYQVAMYLPGAPADNPYHTSPWVDGTSWSLTGVVDGSNYTFRVRARDGSGFTSGWSAAVNTTVDNSPPTVPQIQPEPAYTNGTNNTVTWWPSEDMGVGNVSYEYQFSNYPTFPEKVYCFTDETYFTLTNLLDTTFYYRVRAKDDFGHTSPWSAIERSAQDSTPPILPMVMEEPELTPGTTNVFNWHSTWDTGIGGVIYYYQIATSPTFAPETIHAEYPTALTTIGTADLADGQTYYFRVAALDGFGHRSEWSDLVWSTQDASPPTAPVIHPLPEYLPAGPFTLSWSAAIDHGVGVSHYEVWYYMQGPPGSSPMVHSFMVIGQSMIFTERTGGKWYFSVYAVDRFGQSGPASKVNVTFDGTPPTVPAIEDPPEFSNGTSITLSWPPSTDDLSGVSGYQVSYFREGFPETVRHIDTNRTSVTIFGLVDYTTYWYGVHAIDGVGNRAEGHWIAVTVDDAPPYPVHITSYPSTYFDGVSFEFEWSEAIDLGVGEIEYNLYWDYEHSHALVTVMESGWMTERSYNVSDLGEHVYHVWVAARDSFGHMSLSSEVTFTVSHMRSEVEILSPEPDTVLTGTVMIHGWLQDAGPMSYTVLYRSEAVIEWEFVQYWEALTFPDHIYVPWDTSGLPDGDYKVSVALWNWAGSQFHDEVNVTLANARISVSPNDIVLSDWDPDEGGPPIFMVVVHNHGDSAAENLSVQVFEDGVMLERTDGVRIEPNSYVDLYYDLDGPGRRTIMVKVTSDLYDTGEVLQNLLVEEKDENDATSVTDSAAWVGILAIVLAVIAIALNLAGRMRTPAPEEESGDAQVDVADAWVESRDEET